MYHNNLLDKTTKTKKNLNYNFYIQEPLQLPVELYLLQENEIRINCNYSKSNAIV